MYGVLNDVSAAPAGVVVQNNWQLIKDVIDITTYLSNNYSFERLRVPRNFENLSIAGGPSINDYRAMYPQQIDIDRLISIESFIANNVSNDDAELITTIDAYENGNPIDLYINDQSSLLLAGAFVLKLPAISFKSLAVFTRDRLDCEFVSLNDENILTRRNVQVDNIYDSSGYNTHSKLLIEIKAKAQFTDTVWDASSNPCWNKEVMDEVFKEYNYPGCLSGRSSEERLDINKRVAEKILISNGWEEDLNLKRINAGRTEIWRIYKARSSRNTTYISVDLGEGEFEMQDRRGKWFKTIFFDGRDTGKDYSKYKRSKNKDGHHINLR